MTKQFNTRIDDNLDIRLRLYAAHLSCTKAEAGARAMSQGIPSWVMAVPPSVARAMGSENELAGSEDQVANDDYLAQAFEDES